MKTRMLQILSVMMVLGLVLSACQPQVVEVEKEVVVTQVVEKEVEVEKVVEVEVEKVVEVEVEKVVEVEKSTEDAIGFVDIAPGEPVHIAYMLATSGAVEFLGADSLGGIEIAIEEYGQLHGHDILLTGEDSLCSAEGGQTAAVKVAADPTILGVLGTNCSSAGTAASVVLSEAGMVMISPTNTSPALTNPDETWNPGYYRTAHNDKFQGRVAAEFAYNELGLTKAAALHDGDPYTEGLASVFAEVFADLGGTVTSFEAVNKGDTDMRPVLTTIAAGDPEVLYFPIFEPEGNFVGAQSQEVPGLESVTLMGADGLLVKSFGPNTGPAAVGMYLSGPYISEDVSAYASFLAKYEANTGGPPPAGFAAHAYDGANILLASIAKAAIVDDDGTLHVGRQALRDAVGSTYRYGGLTGILSCDEYGDCATGEALAVFQLSADNVASEDNWPPEVVYTPTGGSEIAGRCAPTDISEVDEVVIGATAPLSKPGSVVGGRVMQAAFSIAVDEINDAGGILGKPLRIIINDTEGLPERGTAVMERLITLDCVPAVVGEYHSAVGLTMKEVAHKYHIPIVFSETYNDKITSVKYPEVFRIAPTSTFTAQMDGKWLSEVGDYNGDGELFAVIVAENTGYGTGQVKKAETWFPEYGIDLEVFLADLPTQDFAPIIARIGALATTPDAIFIKVTGETSYNAQQQMAEAGLGPNDDTIVVANQVALTHTEFWENVPDGNYAVVPRVGPWSAMATEVGNAFADKYRAQMDRWPEAYAFEAYDALKIMANAIENAGSLDADAIIAALEATDLEGAAGHYTFPYGSSNPPDGVDVPDFMWHQWADVPLLYLQYTEVNQHSDDVEVIWPAAYRTSEGLIVRPGG